MRARAMALALALGVASSVVLACGSSSSGGAPGVGPSPAPAPGPAPAPPVWRLSGQVRDTDTGERIIGAAVTVAGQTVHTDAEGRFTVEALSGPAEAHSVGVGGDGLLDRTIWLRPHAATREVDLSVIRLRAPFSLSRYEQLVRGSLDQRNEPSWRWRGDPPNFHIWADEALGIGVREIDGITQVIRAAVPALTGAVYQAGAIEWGPADRVETGWITLAFFRDADSWACGRARIGANPGRIEVNLVPQCLNPCGAIYPPMIAHEIGHALGFFHSSDRVDLMQPIMERPCGDFLPSDAERYHARIAYQRPRGNAAPDADPPASAFLVADAAPVWVACPGR